MPAVTAPSQPLIRSHCPPSPQPAAFDSAALLRLACQLLAPRAPEFTHSRHPSTPSLRSRRSAELVTGAARVPPSTAGVHPLRPRRSAVGHGQHTAHRVQTHALAGAAGDGTFGVLLEPGAHVRRVAAVPARLAPREPRVEAGRALAAGAPARRRGTQLDHTERAPRQRLPTVRAAHRLQTEGRAGGELNRGRSMARERLCGP